MNKLPIDIYVNICKARAALLKAVDNSATYLLNKYYKCEYKGLPTTSEDL